MSEPDRFFASPEVEAVDGMGRQRRCKQARLGCARNSTFKPFGLQVEQATSLTAATSRGTGKQENSWLNRSKCLRQDTQLASLGPGFLWAVSPSPPFAPYFRPKLSSFHDKAYRAQASLCSGPA
ncbi:hypothetical protein CGRA01v4_02638 [Colletotrichum graminicola]|nr:hypothetical protein CGRA01v4_02638 [Colletotrichum graminicola]